MRFRTFVAVDVSPFSRDRLRGLKDQFGDVGAEVRWIEPANMHLTLVFLGEVNDRDLVEVCRTVVDVCAALPPFAFTLNGVSAFPTPRRPRTLIAKVTEGAEQLAAIHTALEPALAKLGCYRREDRAFTPHVTVGRVQREADPELGTALIKFADWQGGQTQVREVRVLSSRLQAEGPEYSVLGRARLGGRA